MKIKGLSILIYLIFSFIFCGKTNAVSRASDIQDLSRLVSGNTDLDPVKIRQIRDLCEATFSNLSQELEVAELLPKIAKDSVLRSNLRGRLAEDDFLKRNASQGWRKVSNPTAPQNDVWRRLPDGRIEGGQIKTHKNIDQYISSMLKDDKAERFIVPDDHLPEIHKDLEVRRQSALRINNHVEARRWAHNQQRLMPLGRNFHQLERPIDTSAHYYKSICKASRMAGKVISVSVVMVGILDESINVYELATGKNNVEAFMKQTAKIGVQSMAAWGVGNLIEEGLIAAGSTGNAPMVAAVIVGGVVYIVADFAFDKISESLKCATLTDADIQAIWPRGAPWVNINNPSATQFPPGVPLPSNGVKLNTSKIKFSF